MAAKRLLHALLTFHTVALLGSRPALGSRARIRTIPGRPQSAFEVGPGCVFAARCPFVTEVCTAERPVLRPIDGDGDGHQVACHRVEEIRDDLARFTEAAS